MIQVVRRHRAALADHDRHQHRDVAVVAEAVRAARGVQDHVLGAEAREDHLAVPFPADRQDPLQDGEGFLDFVRVRCTVVAHRLVHHAQGEVLRRQRARIVGAR